MRDIFFLVADKNMQGVFTTFLTRGSFHRRIGCGQFNFDPEQDIQRHPRKDPGVFNEAGTFLKPFRATHRRAVVVIDVDWSGSPGPEQIQQEIERQLSSDWAQHAVIVIDPELEQWIWVATQRPDGEMDVHPHVAAGLKFNGVSLRDELIADKNWNQGTYKPFRPKDAVEAVLEQSGTPRSSNVYRNIIQQVSVRGCQDDAFKALVAKLQEWFVPGGQA